MSFLRLAPQNFPRQLAVSIPGSKSITQRALILAALSKGATRLLNPATGDDSLSLIRCLSALGIEIESGQDEVLVYGRAGQFKPAVKSLSVGNGGTTLRFLLPLLCFTPGLEILLTAETRLSERPITELVSALSALGAKIDYVDRPEHLPLQIEGIQPRPGQVVEIDASRSSQFLSALLLASRAFGYQVKALGRIASPPYVTLTEELIEAFPRAGFIYETSSYPEPLGRGIPTSSTIYETSSRFEFQIESDWSSATFFLTLACVSHRPVQLASLRLDSPQPDRAFLDLLVAQGGTATSVGDRITFMPPDLSKLSADFSGMPDAAVPAAVLAATLPGESVLSGLATLRHKESDRLAALETELSKIGAKVKISGDSLYVSGGSLRPARIKTYNDHRLAMSFATLGALIDGLEIEEPEVVNKSYPEFWAELGLRQFRPQ